jgi:nuclear pore complex protein Nup85
LKTLLNHSSADLQGLVNTLIPLVESQPRLTGQKFNSEREFISARRRWHEKIMALRITMDRVPEEDRSDDFENWWENLSDIVGILEGRGDVLMRVCGELGADWKEVCAAWGIFVDPRLRRNDLTYVLCILHHRYSAKPVNSDVASQVLYDMPPDPTLPEDKIQAAVFSGRVNEALIACSELDPWLSGHLVDVLEPIGLTGKKGEE